MSQHSITILPLTFIHIGTGEELGPLDYVVGKGKEGHKKYIRFSSEKVASVLDGKERAAFDSAIDNDDIIELRNIFKRNLKGSKALLYSSALSNEVAAAYEKKLEDKNNQLLVHEMYRKGRTLTPLVPASSIKGAVRTAVLNGEANVSSISLDEREKRKSKRVEQKLFDYTRLTDDPFRAIRLSDARVEGKNTQLVTKVYNYRPNGSPQFIDKMQIFVETVRGQLANGDARIKSTLDIDENAQKFGSVSKTIDKSRILNDCYDFYIDRFNDEVQHFYNSNAEIRPVIEKLVDFIQKETDNKNATLIRLGRFSQRENMVIHKYARETEGKSRMVAGYSGAYLPFGWSIMYIE